MLRTLMLPLLSEMLLLEMLRHDPLHIRVLPHGLELGCRDTLHAHGHTAVIHLLLDHSCLPLLEHSLLLLLHLGEQGGVILNYSSTILLAESGKETCTRLCMCHVKCEM